jgi:hypothetical protein
MGVDRKKISIGSAIDKVTDKGIPNAAFFFAGTDNGYGVGEKYLIQII